MGRLFNIVSMENNNNIVLTPASLALFLAYAKDAANWSGNPLVGGNVGGSKQDAGNLTDLKKHRLLVTFESDHESWVRFTEAGIELAVKHGVSRGCFES